MYMHMELANKYDDDDTDDRIHVQHKNQKEQFSSGQHEGFALEDSVPPHFDGV